MVQRSATCVLSAETADREVYSKHFAETMALEDADLVHQSVPNKLSLQMAASGGTERFKHFDKELHDGLRAKGYNLTWELDPKQGEIGLIGFYLEKLASGSSEIIHYIGRVEHIHSFLFSARHRLQQIYH